MPAQKKDNDLALWKNHINRETLTDMADKLGRACKGFDRVSFISETVTPNFLMLELKERIRAVAESLKKHLPSDYSQATRVLIAVAPQLNAFHNWILTTYVELYGLDHYDQSMKALEELTKHGTGEFAIRPFILADLEQALRFMNGWAESPNEHVRRLAAEGARPRGVWVAHVPQFRKDPSDVIALLDKLRADESLYVRKAVANNLNDISRDNPKAAIATAKRWQKDRNKFTDWIIKRGMRTLIKEGHREVFPLLGFASNPKIALKVAGRVNKTARINGSVTINFDLESIAAKTQKLAIDYEVTYLTKAGKQSRKIFKLAEKQLGAGEALRLSLTHNFVDHSTRTHYPGRHSIAIQVNGTVVHTFEIQLTR